MKQQKCDNTPGWPLIIKMSTLFLLQLLKLKKIKCLYFFDHTSFEEDIRFLSFCDFMKILKTPLASNKMLKSWYLPQMTSDQKNKGTLFSSTLKVEDKKVLLFFWLDINWGRYEPFVIFLLVGGFPVPLGNNKITITHQDELWSWKWVYFYFFNFQSRRK